MGKGKQNKFKARNAVSYRREVGSIDTRQGRREPLIVLSFRDFDRNQGQSFEEWEHERLLALAVGKLREVCQLTVGQATAQQVIKPYTKVGFPPASGFVHPRHVSPDVTWSSMHLQRKEYLVGSY